MLEFHKQTLNKAPKILIDRENVLTLFVFLVNGVRLGKVLETFVSVQSLI